MVQYYAWCRYWKVMNWKKDQPTPGLSIWIHNYKTLLNFIIFIFLKIPWDLVFTGVSSCSHTKPLYYPTLTEVRNHYKSDIICRQSMSLGCELSIWTAWNNQLWVSLWCDFYAPACIFLNHKNLKMPVSLGAQVRGSECRDVWLSL